MKRTRRRAEVLSPPIGVVDAAVDVERQRIDGEVAAARVGRKIPAERDLGVTSVRLNVFAERGRLDRLSVHDERHGPVSDAGRRDLEAGGSRAADHFARSSPSSRGRNRPGSPSVRSRTAPPTRRVSSPASLRAASARASGPRRRTAPDPSAFRPRARGGRSFDMSGNQHAVLLMRRNIYAVAARRERLSAVSPSTAPRRGRRAPKSTPGRLSSARPRADSGARSEIDRVDGKGAEKKASGSRIFAAHEQNSFSYMFRKIPAVAPQI